MPKKEPPIKIDTTAGSRSYNRLDMQVSQTIHMAIDFYDDLNYLFVLDYYDDIAIFDLDVEPLAVSYYQMKTSEDTITINSAIKEDWIAKLHEQLKRPEGWIVKELGLITNTPLEISYNHISGNGTKSKKNDKLYADKTRFTEMPSSIQQKIKADIAKKCGIPEEIVDLSKFAHLRTTLTIDRHRDLVEKELGDFLYDKYPRIKVDTIKAIYGSLIDLLTKRQEYEHIPQNASLDEVRKHKGFSRGDLSRVIDKAIILSLPTFEDVLEYSGVDPEMKGKLSLPYVQILTDSNKKNDESFPTLFKETCKAMTSEPYSGSVTVWEYGQRIGRIVHEKEPILKIPYNLDYISVLTICLLINESRRNS